MRRRDKGNHSLLTQDDLYYDGFLDPTTEGFCECLQKKVNLKIDDGWDKYEDLEEDDIEWND